MRVHNPLKLRFYKKKISEKEPTQNRLIINHKKYELSILQIRLVLTVMSLHAFLKSQNDASQIKPILEIIVDCNLKFQIILTTEKQRNGHITKSTKSTEIYTTNGASKPQLLSEIHYNDVIMSAMASQIISLTIVYSTVYSGTDEGKH